MSAIFRFPSILTFPREGGRNECVSVETSPLRGEVGELLGEPGGGDVQNTCGATLC